MAPLPRTAGSPYKGPQVDMTEGGDTITFVQFAQSNSCGLKKPDSQKNLASEEGDEKLLVGLRIASDGCPTLSTLYIVSSEAESLAKTEDTAEITLSLREFKG